MVKANREYDISFIEPTGSTEIGLMLAQKNGVPIWSEYDDPALAQQFFSGDPSYGNLPPEKELQLAQSDWRAGFGLEVYDSNDDKRYQESWGMDLRFRGRAQCGPELNQATIPTGIVKASYDFNDDLYIGVTKSSNDDGALCRLNGAGTEFGEVKSFTDKGITNLIEHTDGKGYIALGGTNKYYHMAAELVVENCEAAWDELNDSDVTETADNTAGYVMNGTYSAKFEIGADLSAGDLIATHDMTSVDLHTYTDTVLWIYSSITLSANDLQLIFDDTAKCAGTPVKAVNIPAVTANTWTSCPISLGDASGMTDIISIGLKMVAEKAAFNLWVDDVRVGAYTESSQADGKADFFTLVDDKLRKGIKPNQLASAIAPETDGWSAVTKVGSTAQDITDLVAESGQFFIMKEDMPFYLDTEGNVHRLIPELKTLETSTSGANSLAWQGKIYIPCGTQGLVEYDPITGKTTWRSPAKFAPGLEDFVGRVHALASDESYLFAVIKSSASDLLSILSGRQEEIDGVVRWVWHPICYNNEKTGCQIAFTSSVYKKRLYMPLIVNSTEVDYMPLPTTYGDPDSDTNYTFFSGGGFTTPWLHANFKADDKAFIRLTLTMEDTSDTEYFTVGAYIKGEAQSHAIGNFKTSPTTTKYIPATSAGGNPVGVMIQFVFTAVTGDTSTTPKLLGYDCRAVWYPTKRWLIGCSVKCKDNIVRKDKQTDTQTADQIDTAITDAVETSWPFTLYPPDYAESGDEIKVKILRAEKVMTKNMSGQNPEYQYNLLLAKTPLS